MLDLLARLWEASVPDKFIDSFCDPQYVLCASCCPCTAKVYNVWLLKLQCLYGACPGFRLLLLYWPVDTMQVCQA